MKIQKIGMVQIIIQNSEGQVVIGKKKDGALAGFHCFPGGHIEEGESPLTAVIREMFEETDLIAMNSDITEIGLLDILRMQEGKECIVHMFFCTKFTGTLKPCTEEFESLIWCPILGLYELNLAPGEDVWMREFFQNGVYPFHQIITCGKSRTDVRSTSFQKIPVLFV